MKLIPLFLLVGMLAVSGWSKVYEPEPYSPELIKKAEQGDANAQFNLGVCYYFGKSVVQNYKEAVKWYTKAAEQGDAAAEYNLGVFYYRGEGVPQDYNEAVKWWTKAADQGNEAAQRALQKSKSK